MLGKDESRDKFSRKTNVFNARKCFNGNKKKWKIKYCVKCNYATRQEHWVSNLQKVSMLFSLFFLFLYLDRADQCTRVAW